MDGKSEGGLFSLARQFPDPRVPARTAALGEAPAPDPEAWRELFARWLEVACARHSRCSGGVGCLHVAFCEWTITQDDVPCNRLAFECLLRESGFVIDEAAGVVLVSGLTFREDVEAVGL